MTRTVKDCKSILFKMGIKHGVSPRLISERLLSAQDKKDMLDDLITFETLDCMIRAWKEGGMLNYVEQAGELKSDFSTDPSVDTIRRIKCLYV